MNFGTIAKYAAAVFGVQFIIGFSQGLLFPITQDRELILFGLVASALVSFLGSATVFALAAKRHGNRPLRDAVLVLMVYAAISFVFVLLLSLVPDLLSDTPLAIILFDTAVLLASALFGTLAGLAFRGRHRLNSPADA